MVMLRMLAGAAAASGPKSSQSWTFGNYRYTEPTYDSAAERQAMNHACSHSAARVMASSSSPDGSSLSLIDQPLITSSHGLDEGQE